MKAQTHLARDMENQAISRRRLVQLGASGLVGAVIGTNLLESRVAKADVVGWKAFTNPTSNFTTSSKSLVKSTLPTNPTFTKQYDDTSIWIICAIDLVSTVDTTMFNAVMLNGTTDILQVSVAAFANGLVVVNMTDIIPGIPAGTHTFPIYAAVTLGSGTWLMPAASYRILELSLPPSQP